MDKAAIPGTVIAALGTAAWDINTHTRSPRRFSALGTAAAVGFGERGNANM